MLSKMLFTIPTDKHTPDQIKIILKDHPEVKFVSLAGIDIGGYITDEKIPVKLFLEDMETFFQRGVQTDGSSVVLPKIATLNNAKVDIIPDLSVNWYVDYNFSHIEEGIKLPVGTLRIPSILVHNDTKEVGSRSLLKNTVKVFERTLLELFQEYPELLQYFNIPSYDEIESIEITAATELEFWVKTPDDKADREQLSTSQVLKEQYWKRTIGSVRTSLEKALVLIDKYGFEVEMGHKEVGGVRAKLGNSGEYDHIMEQLEIDWKYSNAIQAADNEMPIKYIVKDVFRQHGLEVSFLAKPIEHVAGSGEHTHIGIAAKLKNGKTVNLFAPRDFHTEFMSQIGYGAMMGLLKHYEIVNPFVTATNDAFNRLKPGYEEGVCIVTSLGNTPDKASRNRTVLVGLIRDSKNPLATRFELRSPNPKSNTYLVVATSCLAMLDGIKAAVNSRMSTKELEQILSKEKGEEVFYLEKDRVYRSERDVFDEYTAEERNALFGKAPKTVWENLRAFDKYPEKLQALMTDGVFDEITVESYKEAILGQWATELYSRIIPNNMDTVRECKKLHSDDNCVDYDLHNWEEIQKLRIYLGQDTLSNSCLLTRIKQALDQKDYDLASSLQVEMQEKVEALIEKYINYKKNIL